MKLLVISSAPIIDLKKQYFMYAPYHKEMCIWARQVDSIQFCCPIWKEDKKLLVDEIAFSMQPVIALKEFDITKPQKIPFAIWASICNVFILFKAIQNCDHLHLRCPGNMTLLAAFVQIFFPRKRKTAKYAGNWDPKSNQPITYKIQKWILSNTFLTRNMQVLVYGEWPKQSKNIKPFFTATYNESEIISVTKPVMDDEFKFLFVGTLSKGKQPLYAIQIVEKIKQMGKNICLDMYGEGILREELERYIIEHNLESIIRLKGNQPKDTIKEAYQNSQFLVLPSKSEGWPKAVAEAMFWGCIPLTTAISCVPYMIDEGKRGVLLREKIEADVAAILKLLDNPNRQILLSENAKKWSQQFTNQSFENAIKKMIRE